MEDSETQCTAPNVVIIGCGPSGISFLHAVAMRKKKMEDSGDLLGLSKLPIVTCFERAAEPGGVWRAQRCCSSEITSKSYLQNSTDDFSGDEGAGGPESNSLVQYFSAVEIERETSYEEYSQQADATSVSNGLSTSDSSESSSDEDEDDDEYYLRQQASHVAKRKGDTVRPTHHSGTNMYEALWTNGPKETFEYSDYTFEDHFKHELPVYMPRQYLLDYILERVTRKNPNIFLDNVKFNTQVNYIR